ncbi:MAG: glycosyltransferase [Zoogloea sp.]|nr:glycosyltransferase [Zoogloea sp.]
MPLSRSSVHAMMSLHLDLADSSARSPLNHGSRRTPALLSVIIPCYNEEEVIPRPSNAFAASAPA